MTDDNQNDVQPGCGLIGCTDPNCKYGEEEAPQLTLITDEQYQDLFQIGETAEMRGVSDSVGKQALIAQDEMGRKIYEREIWNAAIETAANHMIATCWNGRSYAEVIRRLKK